MIKLSLISSPLACVGTAAMLALSTPAFANTATTDGVFGCDIDEATGKATRAIEVKNGTAMTVSTAHLTKVSAPKNMSSIMDSTPATASKSESATQDSKFSKLPINPPPARLPVAPVVKAAPALPTSCPAGTKASEDGQSCMATSDYQF